MPFTKHIITPINISECIIPVGERNELECLSNLTLANIIRQLSSLGEHANQIFNELTQDAHLIALRTQKLSQRLEALKVKSSQLDLQQQQQLQQNYDEPFLHKNSFSPKNQFKSQIKIDQLLHCSTMPESIRKLYQQAEAPPALNRLNEFRSDGKDCLKFYTDPEFFFNLWRDEMMHERKTRLKTNKKSSQNHHNHKKNDENQYKSSTLNNNNSAKHLSIQQQQQQQQQNELELVYQQTSNISIKSNGNQKNTMLKNILSPPSLSNSDSKRSLYIDDKSSSISSSINGSPLHGSSSSSRPICPPPPIPQQLQQQSKRIDINENNTHSLPPPPSPPQTYFNSKLRNSTPSPPPPPPPDDLFELPLPPPPPELIDDFDTNSIRPLSTVIIKTQTISQVPPAPPPPPPLPDSFQTNTTKTTIQISNNNNIKSKEQQKSNQNDNARQFVLDDIKRGQFTLRAIKENERKEKEQAAPMANTVTQILDFINTYRTHVHNSSDDDDDGDNSEWDDD